MRHHFLLFFWVWGLSGCGLLIVDDKASKVEVCAVERLDVATNVVTDRYEFGEFGMVRHAWQLSPGTRGERVNHYEGGRLVWAEVEAFHQAGDEGSYAPWQRGMVVFEVDTAERYRLRFEYDEEGRLALWETQMWSKSVDEAFRSVREVEYRYDERGRKVRQEERYVNTRSPASVVVREYLYLDGDDMVDEIRNQMSNHTSRVRFENDPKIKKVLRYAINDEGFGPLRVFDARGRLVSMASGGEVRWNEADQIVDQTLGVQVRYTYADGRLSRAMYEDGSGYVQTYSAGCPVGFSHPRVTPNTLYFEHYEGPPDHHTWSSY
jgi:hypothetical protein